MKKARPTEYRGVRYRSKSEAMFARYLDLLIERNYTRTTVSSSPWNHPSATGLSGGFIYEPRWQSDDGWTPDFIKWDVGIGRVPDGGATPYFEIPILQYDLIEYKPNRPTDTYVEEFARRCHDCIEKLYPGPDEYFTYRCTYSIYFGSVYTDERGRFDLIPLIGSGDIPNAVRIDEDWLADFEEEVRDTRFDLKESDG